MDNQRKSLGVEESIYHVKITKGEALKLRCPRILCS